MTFTASYYHHDTTDFFPRTSGDADDHIRQLNDIQVESAQRREGFMLAMFSFEVVRLQRDDQAESVSLLPSHTTGEK
jgi:hypothetical protein